MNLLFSSTELRSALADNLRNYDHFEWAVAWASVGFPQFDYLSQHPKKARRIIVGTHFYQTHPDFLDQFSGHSTFRFVLRPSGVFHPKIYYFENTANNWSCIVGSPNFTASAFNLNAEAAVLFDSDEPNAHSLRHRILAELDEYWDQGWRLTKAQLAAYRIRWKQSQPRRSKLADVFNEKDATKSTVETTLFRYDWPAYYAALRKDPYHDFTMRLTVLKHMASYFGRGVPFHAFSDEERRQVAGTAPDGSGGGVLWRYFGSMVGAGKFKSAINHNDPGVSAALDLIPRTGTVTEKDFLKYAAAIQAAFPQGGVKLATATRLAAMKRPDVFVCLDSANVEKLAHDFGIPINRINGSFAAYWPEIIARIQDTAWWQSPPPARGPELAAWEGRAALVDALYYEPN